MARIGEALRAALPRLPGDTPRIEAELLLAQVLERSRAWLYAHAEDELGAADATAFDALLQRRAAGEPVAQLVGRREFWTLDLAVSADTLIPRPETERLVELALERLPPAEACAVLDLGTGTGAIALAIASERPLASVTAVDASPGALAVARRNAASLALERVRILASDWYAALSGERYDVIVSNPPYLAQDDPHLARGDLRFEPRSALASGHDGLDALRAIVAAAPAHLRPRGWLLVEHGFEQGAAVRDLFVASGLVLVGTERDLEQRERVTLGRLAS